MELPVLLRIIQLGFSSLLILTHASIVFVTVVNVKRASRTNSDNNNSGLEQPGGSGRFDLVYLIALLYSAYLLSVYSFLLPAKPARNSPQEILSPLHLLLVVDKLRAYGHLQGHGHGHHLLNDSTAIASRKNIPAQRTSTTVSQSPFSSHDHYTLLIAFFDLSVGYLVFQSCLWEIFTIPGWEKSTPLYLLLIVIVVLGELLGVLFLATAGLSFWELKLRRRKAGLLVKKKVSSLNAAWHSYEHTSKQRPATLDLAPRGLIVVDEILRQQSERAQTTSLPNPNSSSKPDIIPVASLEQRECTVVDVNSMNTGNSGSHISIVREVPSTQRLELDTKEAVWNSMELRRDNYDNGQSESLNVNGDKVGDVCIKEEMNRDLELDFEWSDIERVEAMC